MRAIRRFTVRPVLPEPLRRLEELATNLRWSWHPPTQDLFETIDRSAWTSSAHDPVSMLGLVPPERLRALAGDPAFVSRLEVVTADLDTYMTGDRWYQSLGESAPRQIAYFSPEFGITAVLPQYSGGLGILAGDHLKSASDLGVPILGVGLLYRHGYFRQSLSREGWQQERYPIIDPDELPLTLLREHDGAPAKVSISVPGDQELLAHIWVAQVGRVPLLLLDSDIEENPTTLRDVTDRLYGGGGDHRLLQEVLLGVGGIRAIRTYCRITGAPEPEVFHTNEGHAGFLGVERIREFIEADGLDFDAAVEKTRAGTVFTTHTPVPAGIDRFERDLIEMQFGGANVRSGVPVDLILALGAENFEGGDPNVFNMAVMGFRLAGRANGVSQLHGHVSRGMFSGLWPGFDEADIPITSITNGVHAPTWVAREVFEVAEREQILSSVVGSDDWSAVDEVSGRTMWETKRRLREKLVKDVRQRVRQSWVTRGASKAELGWVDNVLSPDVLTIGFARRVPTYKRLTLMLRDPERLKSLLLHPDRPIQLVIAGKSHPADDTGKKLIQEIVRFSDDPAVRRRIVFLPNYDIAMAQPLYPGCDVWLNNPLRPYEACGTSGMKAALNGGLNLSILDGWWDEWYDGDNGWAIPSADGVDDVERRDDLEATALYDLIENEVAPRFYDLDEERLPLRWIEMVRHTLKSLGPKVLASRMVRDYVHQLYLPAAESARKIEDGADAARQLAGWKKQIRAVWPQVRIEHVESFDMSDAPALGQTLTVRVYASLGLISPEEVAVQLVHGRVAGDDQLRDPHTSVLTHAETYEAGRHRFDAEVALDHTGPFGYTVRILPHHPLLVAPAEVGVVAWPPDVNEE
ncbi:MAG: alpha-glucan family phosphorylase, partial [Nocardioidaceae bacterium]|nr:alpha-glucan family phosphorylase [Nocardioidaceae bacterium]